MVVVPRCRLRRKRKSSLCFFLDFVLVPVFGWFKWVRTTPGPMLGGVAHVWFPFATIGIPLRGLIGNPHNGESPFWFRLKTENKQPTPPLGAEPQMVAFPLPASCSSMTTKRGFVFFFREPANDFMVSWVFVDPFCFFSFFLFFREPTNDVGVNWFGEL